MIDIQEQFQTFSATLGWVFSYGNETNQNLLMADEFEDNIYLLLDTVKESEAEPSEFGGDGEITYTGNFMLMIQSDFDNVYHNQNDADENKSRYIKNIKPLKRVELPKLKNLIDCSDMKRELWEVVEVINMMDANLDGVVVTFSIKHL